MVPWLAYRCDLALVALVPLRLVRQTSSFAALLASPWHPFAFPPVPASVHVCGLLWIAFFADLALLASDIGRRRVVNRLHRPSHQSHCHDRLPQVWYLDNGAVL